MEEYFNQRINLFFVRHGQSEANEKKVICGQLDSPLSKLGIKQARQLKESLDNEGLNFDKCYTSPLSRAYKTAEIVYGSNKYNIISDLVEINAGDYSHLTTKELIEINPTLHNHGLEPTLKYPKGESLEELNLRTIEWFENMIKQTSCSQKILIVAHWGSINIMIQHILKIPLERYSSFYLQNCHLAHLTVNDDNFNGGQLHRFNFI